MDDTWVVQRDIGIRNIQWITLPPKHPLVLPFPLNTILQYLLGWSVTLFLGGLHLKNYIDCTIRTISMWF